MILKPEGFNGMGMWDGWKVTDGQSVPLQAIVQKEDEISQKGMVGRCKEGNGGKKNVLIGKYDNQKF